MAAILADDIYKCTILNVKKLEFWLKSHWSVASGVIDNEEALF